MEVESDIQINRYNTNKKISQLNKVIQYLSYHLQERIFQVESIKKKYEAKEAEIIDQIDDKLKPIFEQLNVDQVEIKNTVSKYYQNKRDMLFQAFQAKEDKINSQIKSKISEIQNETDKAMKVIANIQSNLDEQFKFLKDKSKSDVSAIRLTILQSQKDHQLSLKKFDAEENKKIKSLVEKSQKRIKEMEEIHIQEINELMNSAIEPQPQISDRTLKSLWTVKNYIMNLKTTMANETKEINKQKHILQQNIIQLKERLKLLLLDCSSIDDTNSKLLAIKKEETEKIYKEFTNEYNQLKFELDSLKHRLENEYMILENELDSVRCQLKSQRSEKEKEINIRSQKSENDIVSYFQSLMDELTQRQKERQLEKQSFKSHLDKLSCNIANFDENHIDELTKLKDQKEKSLIEFNKEKEKAEIDLKNRINKEVEVFHKLKSQYENKIQQLSSTQSQFSKNEEELRKLQIILETNKRSFSSSMTNLTNSINEELATTQRELTEKYEKYKNQLESQYQVVETKSKSEIESYKSQLENEYLKKVYELDQINQNSIEEFQSIYAENNQKSLSNQTIKYEENHKNALAELNSIIVPEGMMDLTDEHIHHLENTLKLLPCSINNQKTDLQQFYTKSIDDEEDRHKQKLLDYLAFCRETHDNDYENYQKELKERISVLDIEIKKLRENFKLLEKVSPRLLIINDSIDVDRQKLEEELFGIRNELKEKVKVEERNKIDIIKELNDQIEEQLEQNQNAITKEKDNCKHETEIFKKNYEEQRLKRKKISEASSNLFNDGVRDFNERFEKMSINHSHSISSIQQDIIEMKNKNADDIESIQSFLENEKKRLDKEGRKMARNLPKELKSLKDNVYNMNPELDDKIKEVTKRRDSARNAMINKPMRTEEASVIKRLESQLFVKTTQLTKVGKELLTYRQALIHQENEYNNRFGVDPSVAIMKPIKSRPKTTLDGRRLPKLHNSTYV